MALALSALELHLPLPQPLTLLAVLPMDHHSRPTLTPAPAHLLVPRDHAPHPI